MPTFFSFIPTYILGAIMHYKYFILFPILVIEGPITTIVSGALASPIFNEFNIISLYFFVVFSDIFGDTLYYSIGRYAGDHIIEKFKKLRGIKGSKETKIKDFFKQYGGVSIALGKITHGIGWPIMIAAGNARIPYRKFITYCSLVSIPKTAVLLAIGYYYENDYSLIAYYIGSNTTFVLTIVFIIIAIIYTHNKLRD